MVEICQTSSRRPDRPAGGGCSPKRVGTGLLVTVVVGSGIAAQRLSPDDAGLQLLENSTATVLGLAVLILMFGPVSGAHFNPVVSAADWLLGRRTGTGLAGCARRRLRRRPDRRRRSPARSWPTSCSTCRGRRSPTTTGPAPGTRLGEVVATAGLVALIFALARTGRAAAVRRPRSAPTSAPPTGSPRSTSFANPAVTVGRVFTDTFAGIAPASVPAFVVAQLVGAAVGLGLVLALYPDARTGRRRHVVAHPVHHVPRDPGDLDDRPQAQRPVRLRPQRRPLPDGRRLAAPHLAGEPVEVRSAGSAPADQVNPVAVEAMAEVGIDITAQTPKILTTRRRRRPPTSSSPWAAATPARSSPASATWTGNSTTPPAKASTPSARSATRSAAASRRSSPNSCPPAPDRSMHPDRRRRCCSSA